MDVDVVHVNNLLWSFNIIIYDFVLRLSYFIFCYGFYNLWWIFKLCKLFYVKLYYAIFLFYYVVYYLWIYGPLIAVIIIVYYYHVVFSLNVQDKIAPIKQNKTRTKPCKQNELNWINLIGSVRFDSILVFGSCLVY